MPEFSTTFFCAPWGSSSSQLTSEKQPPSTLILTTKTFVNVYSSHRGLILKQYEVNIAGKKEPQRCSHPHWAFAFGVILAINSFFPLTLKSSPPGSGHQIPTHAKIRRYLCALLHSPDTITSFPHSPRCRFLWQCVEVLAAVSPAFSGPGRRRSSVTWTPVCLRPAGPVPLYFSRGLLLLNEKISHMN